MKLPEVITKRKIRDFRICQKYLEGYSQEEIAQEVGLTQQRVAQILYKNRALLIIDKNYEKIKRINWYKRQLREKTSSKKDGADIQEAIRNEIEGLEVHHTGIPGTNVYVAPSKTYVFTSDPTEIQGISDTESQSRIRDTEQAV